MRTLTLPLLALVLLSLAAAPAAAAERPNIVFFFADDWGRYASCYAATESRPSPNQVVKTPNIDRVAARGTLYKNAFVNAPSCTPCRSALLSGRYFFATGRGAILQGAVWDSTAVPSFPHLLRDSGYHIGETWKVWSPGTPNDAPFGGGKHGYEQAGRAFNTFSQNVTKMMKDGMSRDAAAEKLYAEVTGNFEAFLADRKPGQPFLYWFGPTNVHRTWTKGSGKAIWGIDPDQLQGKLPAFLPDVPEVREDFADYLGEAQAFDGGVGRILQVLADKGELDNTLIVISGDHGAPGFPHGKCNLYDFGVGVSLITAAPGQKQARVVDDFVNLMDLAPTFLEAGGQKPAPGMQGRSLMHVINSDKSGQVDPERNFVVTGRERHVAAANDNNLPYPQRAIRTGDYLYIRNFAPDRWPMGTPKDLAGTREAPAALETSTFVAFADMDASPTKLWLVQHQHDEKYKQYFDYAFARRPGEELYDLKKDPDQIHNVAADPAYAEAKQDLAARLMKTLTDNGDPRVTGDGLTFERPPFSDPDQRGTPAKKAAAKK